LTSRQRGAALLLAALLAGRILDRFDLPFEARPESADSSAVRAAPAAASARRAGAAATQDSAGTDPAPAPDPRPPRVAAAPAAPIAINRASARELESLPGVGPVLAARIVAHRDTHGAFPDLVALQRVAGIGPRTAARLSPHLRFD